MRKSKSARQTQNNYNTQAPVNSLASANTSEKLFLRIAGRVNLSLPLSWEDERDLSSITDIIALGCDSFVSMFTSLIKL